MCCSALLCGRFADSQNLVFRFRNVQILEVLSSKFVVLLIFTISVFKLKTFRYGLSRSADCQEWHFQISKRSDNCVMNVSLEGQLHSIRLYGSTRVFVFLFYILIVTGDCNVLSRLPTFLRCCIHYGLVWYVSKRFGPKTLEIFTPKLCLQTGRCNECQPGKPRFALWCLNWEVTRA